MVNHTRIACVHVINMHATAGFDRGMDGLARLVHNVTGPVENITARTSTLGLLNSNKWSRPTFPRDSNKLATADILPVEQAPSQGDEILSGRPLLPLRKRYETVMKN